MSNSDCTTPGGKAAGAPPVALPGRLAHVIELPYLLSSQRSPWYARTVNGASLLRRRLTSLKTFWPQSPLMVISGPGTLAEAGQLDGAAGVLRHPGDRIQGLMLALTQASGDIDCLAVYRADAVFTEPAGTDLLMRALLQGGFDLVAPPLSMPEGLSAEFVITRKCLSALAPLNLPPETQADLPRLVQTISRLEATLGLRFGRAPSEEHAAGPLPASVAALEQFDLACAEGLGDGISALPLWLERRSRRSPPLPVWTGAGRPDGQTVVFVSLATSFSGAEQAVIHLTQGLKRQNWRPVVLLPGESLLSERLRHGGVETALAEVDLRRPTPAAIRVIRHVLREAHARVLHIDSFPVLAAALAAHEEGIPVVQHVRTFQRGSLHPAFYHVDRFVAVSHAVRRELVRHPIDPASVVTVHDGIPWPEEQAAHGGPGAAVRLLLVGRVVPDKRQDFAIEALARIWERYPCELDIVGQIYPHEMAFHSRLLERVRTAGLEGHVHFAGFVDDVSGYYRRAAVSLVCNWQEPLSMATLESMALGCPVLVPRRAGAAELVEDGVSGLLYEPGDLDDFCLKLTSLLDRPTLWRQLQLGGLARVKTFSLNSHTARIVAVYESCLSSEPYSSGVVAHVV
jgi:glycosyltransferase involved in cell wall biosynthesis